MRKLVPIALFLLLVLLAGCGNDPGMETDSHHIYNFRLAGSLEETRVTFGSDDQLTWGTFETIGLLLGNDQSSSTITSDTHATVPLNSYGDGIFEGTVDFGKFTVNDIRGAVFPYNSSCHYYKSTNDHRVRLSVGGSLESNGDRIQTQWREGVLNGNNISLISAFGAGDVGEDAGTYFVDGKTFRWACALLRFNLFGTGAGMTADEKLLSITFYVDKQGVWEGASNSNRTIGDYVYYLIESDSFLYAQTNSGLITVNLEEPAVLAGRSQANGLKIYMAVAAKGYKIGGDSYFEIKTDRKTYRMPVYADLPVKVGTVTKIGIDLTAAFPNANTLGQLSWINESVWHPVE